MLLHDERQDGRVFAFEFDGAWFTRRRILAIVKAIPGVRIIREGADAWAHGVLCEFDVDEARFIVRSSSGTDRDFWVGPKREAYLPEVERVRKAFAQKDLVSQVFLDGVLLGLVALTASALITIARRSLGPVQAGIGIAQLVAVGYWIVPFWCWSCLRVSVRRASGDRDRCARCGISTSP